MRPHPARVAGPRAAVSRRPVRPRPAGGALRRRTCCIGRGRQQATGRGCRGLGRARRASPARGARAARGPRAGRAQGAARLSRQSGRPLGGGIRRCRARIRRRSPPDVRAFSHPQGWRTFDRGARRARALRRNRRVAHGLGQHADAAQDQAGPGRGPGSVGRARSRHRARCRRRLRSQEPVLSRRAGGPGGRVAAGPPDQMDRGSPRMLHRHQSRARAGLGDGGGGRPRRQAARDPRPSAPRPRRHARRPACRCRRIRPRISSAPTSCRRTGSRSRSASPIWWRRRRRAAPDARKAPS